MSFKLLLGVIALLFVQQLYAIQVIRDIPYTYDGRQTLDLFMPDDTELSAPLVRPAAIVMHAGGWSSGCREGMEYFAEWFAEQGFVVINVSYALAPENKWPAQIADVIQGVWWLKENTERYNINPNKILAVGASAGGHLAAMLGQSSVSNLTSGVDSEIHGIVSIAGPWNLLAVTTDDQVHYVTQLLSVVTPEALCLASPVYQITSHSPPVLIFHGTDDILVPFQQSKDVCEVYLSKGLEHCFLMPLEGYTHNLDVDPEVFFSSIREFLNWWLVQ